MTLLPGDPRHGTPNGYNNHGCHCDLCRPAWSAYLQERKKRRPPLPPEDPRHGTQNAYGNFNCRCRACTDAWNEGCYLRDARNAHREGRLYVRLEVEVGYVKVWIEGEFYGIVSSTGNRTRYWTALLVDGTIVRSATKGPRYEAVGALMEHWEEAHGVRTGTDLVHGSH